MSLASSLARTRTVHLSLDQAVNASPTAVFAALTDWPAQGMWMLGTKVEVREGDGRGVGSVLAAWTGLGPVGFWDTMVITHWDEPYRVDVLHTGSVVRGTGTMEVVALPGGRSRFIWSEDLELPAGVLGAAAWPIGKPAFVAGVKKSLRAFAALVESGQIPR